MALPTDELLTTAEVASLARTRPATVNSWARDGILTATKVGGRWRFAREDVLRQLGIGQAS